MRRGASCLRVGPDRISFVWKEDMEQPWGNTCFVYVARGCPRPNRQNLFFSFLLEKPALPPPLPMHLPETVLTSFPNLSPYGLGVPRSSRLTRFTVKMRILLCKCLCIYCAGVDAGSALSCWLRWLGIGLRYVPRIEIGAREIWIFKRSEL